MRSSASADTSLWLPVPIEIVFGTRVGAQKTQAWLSHNLISELLLCACLPFGVYLSLSSVLGLEFGPYPFVLYAGSFAPNHSPVSKTGAWSSQYLELREESNECDEMR